MTTRPPVQIPATIVPAGFRVDAASGALVVAHRGVTQAPTPLAEVGRLKRRVTQLETDLRALEALVARLCKQD